MNDFITTAWAFDGGGNDWVAYPKGINKDGRALENGLFIGGHTYSCPGDLTGVDAELAIKTGKFTANITTKAKGETFANQWTEAEVKANAKTDVTGIKSIGGGQVIPVEEVDTTITTEWDAEAAATAVADQIKTFGARGFSKFGPTTEADIVNPDGIKTRGKYEAKMAALDKSLNAAFGTRELTGAYGMSHIDTTTEKSWYPTSADPMDALIEEETEAEKMAATIAKAKAALSVDQWAMVMAKASGKSQKEIAEMNGVSENAVSLRWKTIVKKATKATGFAFVA